MRVSHWEKLAVLFHPLTVTAEVEFVDRDLRLFLRVVVVMPGEEIDPNPETRLGGGERELAERRVEVLFGSSHHGTPAIAQIAQYTQPSTVAAPMSARNRAVPKMTLSFICFLFLFRSPREKIRMRYPPVTAHSNQLTGGNSYVN